MEIKRILIIIQRSNGDVFLSTPLNEELQRNYPGAKIDYLVNASTVAIAKTLPNIHRIHIYDYQWKKEGKAKRLAEEFALIRSLWKKYDLSINLTASDRGVLYAILSARRSISAVEAKLSKSWWKRLLLSHAFVINPSDHILKHNMNPLAYLTGIPEHIKLRAHYAPEAIHELADLPFNLAEPFVIFHPGAQYDYKIYPALLRNRLLKLLDSLNLTIVITGANTPIDRQIASELPDLPNVYNLIGQTSLNGYIALCSHASAYIGMDTLNMHIAAGLDKPIFAIFGPTLPQIWSPWSNEMQCHATRSAPVQRYGGITLFQAAMPCVPCGKAGCDDRHGPSECLTHITPETIFQEVQRWLNASVSRS